jgi:hypothetical protein
LLDWIADFAGRKPIVALEVCEHFTARLKEFGHSQQLWHVEPLISALLSILREVDERGDEALIGRALQLQDQLLGMDVHGMEVFFDQAARL